MIMSTYHERGQMSRRRWILARADLLRRLLRAVGFVNVDIIYSGAENQLIIHDRALVPDAAPLLAVIDPVLERWGWPVADVWQSHAPLPFARLVQIRVDVVG